MSTSPPKENAHKLFINKPFYKRSTTTYEETPKNDNVVSKMEKNLINIAKKNSKDLNSIEYDEKKKNTAPGLKTYEKYRSLFSPITEAEEKVNCNNNDESSESFKSFNMSDKNLKGNCQSIENNNFNSNMTRGEEIISSESQSPCNENNKNLEINLSPVLSSSINSRRVSYLKNSDQDDKFETSFNQISKIEKNYTNGFFSRSDRKHNTIGLTEKNLTNKLGKSVTYTENLDDTRPEKYISRLKRIFTMSEIKNEEVEKKEIGRCSKLKSCPVLKPHGKFTKFWNFIVFILMVYSIIIMPYKISFIDYENLIWISIENTTDILFICDIIVNFNSAYYDKESVLITSRKKIFLRYLKSWFFIDLLASFPQNLVLNITEENYIVKKSRIFKLARLSKLYRLVRLIRLIRITRIFRKIDFIQRLQEYFSINYGVSRLLSFLFTTLILSHLMGCLWYVIPQIYDERQNWVMHNNLQDEPTFRLYLFSLYWAFFTIFTVGFGDIHAVNQIEYIISILWMLLGVGFYSFTIGTISSILVNMETKENILKNKLNILNEFSKERKLSPSLKDRLKKIFVNNSHKNVFSWMDKQEIFTELPANLKCEISKSMKEGFLKDILFFSNKDDAFIAMVVPFLIPFHFEEKEIIYKKEDQANAIFFLTSGRISLVNDNFIPFCTMVKGCHFGEIDIILKQQKRMHTVISNEVCETLTLARHIIVDIIYKEYPEIYEEMKYISQERLKRHMESEKKLNIKINAGSGNQNTSFTLENLNLFNNNNEKSVNESRFKKMDSLRLFLNHSHKKFSSVSVNSGFESELVDEIKEIVDSKKKALDNGMVVAENNSSDLSSSRSAENGHKIKDSNYFNGKSAKSSVSTKNGKIEKFSSVDFEKKSILDLNELRSYISKYASDQKKMAKNINKIVDSFAAFKNK